MRKWVVAGVALVAIGVSAYLLLQPRKGTVEYHKRGYLKSAATLKSAEPNIAAKVVDEFTQRTLSERMLLEWERFEYHRTALIRFGFLERREYGPYSFPLGAYEVQLAKGLREIRQAKPDFTEAFCERRGESNLAVVVIGLPAEMEKWEKLVRRGDLPRTGQ